MKRLLFNFLTLASALLFLLTLTVTIRSFWTQDCFFHNANNPPRGFTSQYDLWIKKLHDRDPTPLPPNVFVRWRLISAKAGLHFQWIHWDNDHGLDGEFNPMTIDFETNPGNVIDWWNPNRWLVVPATRYPLQSPNSIADRTYWTAAGFQLVTGDGGNAFVGHCSYVALTLPTPVLTLVAGLLPFLWIRNFRRRRSRRRGGLCPHCGYDLRASPTRCPECGASSQIAEEQTE